MKQLLSFVIAFILCISSGVLAPAFAEETETNNETEQTEFYATSPAYRECSISDLYSGGALVIPADSGIKAEIDQASGGLMLSGTAAALSSARIEIKDPFDFDEAPVGRASIDALSDKKIKARASFYLDDEADPFATLSMRFQKGKDAWKRDGMVTSSVLDRNITGEHKVALGIAFDGLDETKETKVLLRSVEFAESSIPVMYFNIDESLGTIAEMNTDPDHKAECYGSVDIEVPESYTPEFSTKPLSTVRGLELNYIRGRGNSTWDTQKKPYKIRFEQKQNLLGMGKNKHWVLLANRYDNSLIRNRMTYWLTRKLSGENGVFAPDCVPVEVVMNGEYYGSYLLTEQIRVGKERVNIDDLEEGTGPSATEEPEISGGYLLSKDYEEDGQNLSTSRDVGFYIESPEFEDGHTEAAKQAQRKYITNFLQMTEEAIFGKDFKDPLGRNYSYYMDVPAAVDYWWIQEFSENGDAYANGSTYLYKERDETDAEGNVTRPGKLYWGPLWDFDYVAWGDLDYDSEPEETMTYTDDPWMKRLKCDPEFVKKLEERWPALDALFDEILKKDGVIDRYAKEVSISEQYDFSKYGFYGEGGGYDYYDDYGEEDQQLKPGEPHTYETEITQLKTWIKNRKAWVSENLDKITPPSYTVKFRIDGRIVETRRYFDEDAIGTFPKVPAKKGYTFVGWKDSSGDFVNGSDTVYQDMVYTASYVKNSRLVKPKDIFFSRNKVYVTYLENVDDDEDYDSNTYETRFSVMPLNARGKIRWSTSNKSIATVDQYGVVSYSRPGTVKITAALPSGKKKSYTLVILDQDTEMNEVSNMRLNKTKLKLKTGAYTQIGLIYETEPCIVEGCSWISTDTKVVSVDENGVLVAKNPGTAIVLAIDPDLQKPVTCTVKVTASKAWKIRRVKNSSSKLKAKALKNGKIRLTWRSVRYSSGYYIYKANKKNGKYKKLATVKKGYITRWTRKVKKGKNRWYKVRPYIKSGKKVYKGKWSKPVKAK